LDCFNDVEKVTGRPRKAVVLGGDGSIAFTELVEQGMRPASAEFDM